MRSGIIQRRSRPHPSPPNSTVNLVATGTTLIDLLGNAVFPRRRCVGHGNPGQTTPSPAIVLKQPPRLGASAASSWLRVFRAPHQSFSLSSLALSLKTPSATPVEMKSLEPKVELMSAGSHDSLHLDALDGCNTVHATRWNWLVCWG
jgi:hypothetical protein